MKTNVKVNATKKVSTKKLATNELVKVTAKKVASKKAVATKKEKAVKVTKIVTPRTESKKTIKLAESVAAFNIDNANSLQKLRFINNSVLLESMNISKIGKNFIQHGDEILTASQVNALDFANIKAFVNSSVKYSSLKLFTANDMVLICNAVIKLHDNATKIAVKVAKQGGKITQK
jgi:hypothetical protein